MSIPPKPTALFSNLKQEHDFEPMKVDGELPELDGTLYLNGCGIFEQFGRRYDHLFECDAAVTAIRLSNGTAYAASRIIETGGLKEERCAGRHLGSFAAVWPTRVKRMVFGGRKNTSNTNLFFWQENLYALGEAGKPLVIDKDSLKSLGETDLNGTIKGSFSAHPHRVESRNCTFNFGLSYGKETKLQVYQLPDNGDASQLCEIPIDHPGMLHDFIVTENYIVFFIPPARLKVIRMLLGLKPIQSNISWSPEHQTEIIIIPIDKPSHLIRFHTNPFMVFHFAGAFEDKGNIYVDYIHYKDLELLDSLGDGSNISWSDFDNHVHGKLHRATINIDDQSFSSVMMTPINCEYPAISENKSHGKYDVIWMQTNKESGDQLQFQISRVDNNGTTLHIPMEPGQLCLEPIIVEGSSDYIVSMVFDSFSQKSHLIIIDSRKMKIISRIYMKQAIPLTFHGCWLEHQT